jgi:hypothetical protein
MLAAGTEAARRTWCEIGSPVRVASLSGALRQTMSTRRGAATGRADCCVPRKTRRGGRIGARSSVAAGAKRRGALAAARWTRCRREVAATGSGPTAGRLRALDAKRCNGHAEAVGAKGEPAGSGGEAMRARKTRDANGRSFDVNRRGEKSGLLSCGRRSRRAAPPRARGRSSRSRGRGCRARKLMAGPSRAKIRTAGSVRIVVSTTRSISPRISALQARTRWSRLSIFTTVVDRFSAGTDDSRGGRRQASARRNRGKRWPGHSRGAARAGSLRAVRRPVRVGHGRNVTIIRPAIRGARTRRFRRTPGC